MIKLVSQLITLFIYIVLLCGFTSYKSTSVLPEKLEEGKGKKIYLEYGCVNCHGTKGKGDGEMASFLDPKPRNFTSLVEMKNLPDSLMMYSIKHGVVGSSMPEHSELNENEINDLVIYLRHFLADYYHMVNMCVTDRHTVDLTKNFENFKIEIDNKKKLSAEIKNNSLIIQATSPIHLINEMSKTKSRTTRNRIKIVNGTGSKAEKILVTVRIHDCIRGQM